MKSIFESIKKSASNEPSEPKREFTLNDILADSSSSDEQSFSQAKQWAIERDKAA